MKEKKKSVGAIIYMCDLKRVSGMAKCEYKAKSNGYDICTHKSPPDFACEMAIKHTITHFDENSYA